MVTALSIPTAAEASDGWSADPSLIGSTTAPGSTDPWRMPASQPAAGAYAGGDPYGPAYGGVGVGYGQPSPYGQPPRDATEPEEQGEEELSPPFFEVGATTMFPLFVGGQATLELPGRFLIRGDIGGMPSAYGNAINSTIQGFAGYDDAVADLIDGSFESALTARISAGIRPIGGLELSGGYTHINLSGQTTLQEVMDAADLDMGLIASVAAAAGLGGVTSDPISIDSTVHAFHLAIAYRWLIADHVTLRATIGYVQALGSSTSVEVDGAEAVAAAVNPALDATVEGVYDEYFKLPFAGLGLGYRF